MKNLSRWIHGYNMSSDALAFAFSVEGLWTKSRKQHILDMFCNPICLFDWCQELISKSVSRLRFLWGGFVAYSITNSKCMPRKYYPLRVSSLLVIFLWTPKKLKQLNLTWIHVSCVIVSFEGRTICRSFFFIDEMHESGSDSRYGLVTLLYGSCLAFG